MEESSPSEEEWRKQAAPTYTAYPWNDAEVAELGKAGGLGMLGYKFHRQTTVNWYQISSLQPDLNMNSDVIPSFITALDTLIRDCFKLSSISRQPQCMQLA